MIGKRVQLFHSPVFKSQNEPEPLNSWEKGLIASYFTLLNPEASNMIGKRVQLFQSLTQNPLNEPETLNS